MTIVVSNRNVFAREFTAVASPLVPVRPGQRIRPKNDATLCGRIGALLRSGANEITAVTVLHSVNRVTGYQQAAPVDVVLEIPGQVLDLGSVTSGSLDHDHDIAFIRVTNPQLRAVNSLGNDGVCLKEPPAGMQLGTAVRLVVPGELSATFDLDAFSEPVPVPALGGVTLAPARFVRTDNGPPIDEGFSGSALFSVASSRLVALLTGTSSDGSSAYGFLASSWFGTSNLGFLPCA